MERTKVSSMKLTWMENTVETPQNKSQTGQGASTGCFKSKKLSSLTDEDDQQQTNGSQLNVGVTEGVTEGGIDDHEEDSAAHSAKGRFLPLQKLPHKTSTHLQKRRFASTATRLKCPPDGVKRPT